MLYYAFLLLLLLMEVLNASAGDDPTKVVPARFTYFVGALGAGAAVDIWPAASTSFYEKDPFDSSALAAVTKEMAACTISPGLRQKERRPASPLRKIETHEGNILVTQLVAGKIAQEGSQDVVKSEPQ